jgi:DNA repair protein RadA/Sms
MDTTDAELNRVLGGGIVPGSHTFRRRARNREKYFITTNILEIAIQTLYVSGEESQKQIKNVPKESPILATTVIFLQKQKTQNIFKQIEAIEPEIVIIDSIQTLHTDYIESTAGTISQIRETTQSLLNLRKQYTCNSDRAHNKRMALLQDRKFWNTWLILFCNLKATGTMYTIYDR